MQIYKYITMILSNIQSYIRLIFRKLESCALIFVTTSSEFAVSSYDVQADYYLLKPFEETKLYGVLDRIHFENDADSRYIEVISDRTPVRVPIQSIVYVDTYSNAIQLHTDAGILKSYLQYLFEAE